MEKDSKPLKSSVSKTSSGKRKAVIVIAIVLLVLGLVVLFVYLFLKGFYETIFSNLT